MICLYTGGCAGNGLFSFPGLQYNKAAFVEHAVKAASCAL